MLTTRTINDTEELNNWKENVLNIERDREQTVNKTEHSNYKRYTDYDYHSNSGHYNYVPHNKYSYHVRYQGHNNYVPHTDRAGYHQNNHTDTVTPHTDIPGHYNRTENGGVHHDYGSGPYQNYGYGSNHHDYNPHYNYYQPHRNGHQNTTHSQNVGGHKQSGHNNRVPYEQRAGYHYNNHTDSNKHVDDSAYHSDNHYNNPYAHNNYTTHFNTGFDHINFIPSKPHFFDNQNREVMVLNGEKDIYFYSYDKNNDNEGSQFVYSKDVYYQVEIRQIRDLKGNSKTTSWKVIQPYSMSDSYRINTVDPLKTGNKDYTKTEGYYEIRITPKNNSNQGVNYIGSALVKEVKIQQNFEPSILVDNPEEFLTFTFGLNGVIDTHNNKLEYSDILYKENQLNEFEGLFINIHVQDEDIEDYLKGFVKIVSGDNTIVNEIPIIWDNGSQIIKSENKLREGYIYISKNDLLEKYKNKSFKNAGIEIHLRDYKDENATMPKGEYLISRRVNMGAGEQLFINIDKVAPTIKEVNNGELSSPNTQATIKLTAGDDISGVEKIILPNGQEVLSDRVNYTVNVNGLYSFLLVDRLGNEGIVSVEVRGIDNNKPVVEIINKTEWTNDNNVEVTIIATDK